MSETSPLKNTDGRTQNHLDASIVFATRDRAHQLRQTLTAYESLDTQGIAWELIVIDNASRDETATVLEQAASRLPLTQLFVAEGGQNRARNQALDCIRGALVVFTDDDVIPQPDCLKAYIAAAHRWPGDVIFGARVEPRFPTQTPDWMRSPEFEFGTTAFARYHPSSLEEPVSRHPYGPSFAIRQTALTGRRFPEHLGPQSGAYAMGGEGYFLRNIAAEGHRYIYVPSAQVEHIVRQEQVEEAWLLKRAHNKGRGQVHLPSQKKPRKLFWGGVPIKLYFATGRAFLRYQVARLFARKEQQIKNGITYQLRLGQIVELRTQHSVTQPDE